MIDRKAQTLPRGLARGLRLAVFEFLWPAIPEIQQIHARLGSSCIAFGIVVSPRGMLSLDQAACRRILSDVVDCTDTGAKAKVSFFGSRSLAKAAGFNVLLMDARVFKNIARDFAPWRLEDGR